MSLNSIHITGRLTKDPELINKNNVDYCKFSIYLRNWKNEVVYASFTAFDKVAESLCEHKKKGDEITVEGEVTSTYKNGKDGKSIFSPEWRANRIHYHKQTRSPEASNEVAYEQYQSNKTPEVEVEPDYYQKHMVALEDDIDIK